MVSGKDFVITMSNLVPEASLGPQFQSDSKMVAAPNLTWAGGGGESASIRDEPLVFPGGKKLSALDMKKLKKLSAPEVHLEKNCITVSVKNIDHSRCFFKFQHQVQTS